MDADAAIASRAINADASRLGEELADDGPAEVEPWEEIKTAMFAMWHEADADRAARAKRKRETGFDFPEAVEIRLMEELLAA